MIAPEDPLAFASRATSGWFGEAFTAPTRAQRDGWPPIARGASTLLLAPTGSGKTLAAFLAAIDRLMFGPAASAEDGVRVLYVSPLKALGVDVERNLRAPLAGIRAVADRIGEPYALPRVGVRTGDTTSSERRELVARPPEILITTPESLYLMLTSRARETLRGVETIILDEIHAVAATKRGSHLALSVERLERLRSADAPLQRIGLSATQRPLEEVARFLGGLDGDGEPRPVEIVDASEPKVFDVKVEVPVEDMARLGEELDEISSGPAAAGPARASIWPSIHPRLLELIRAHRSTLIFVNSRRLAERLSLALNELAEEEVALAHHGSISTAARADIEDRLKRGELPALVATSTLELGIDMGAIDLVIQIESPPSVASGIQRLGRAGHQVGATSRGVIFPKYRLDLLACTAVARHIREGRVEPIAYPRNPLDVLAQQLVAIVSQGDVGVDELYALVRGAAPFEELPRGSFEGVLDMLSGRYPSDDFRDLRPRLTWDRVGGRLSARRGARMVAVTSGGTIPDRGLYGVFLAGSEPPVRVGELDEEMVFETREGDVFLLGASSWRVESIDTDRVLVSPAPGEPGRMPFWRGDGPGRSAEFGRVIGALARDLATTPAERAEATLVEDAGLDARAARNLVSLVRDQQDATGAVPSDQVIVLERFVDQVGDEMVAILTPFGRRVHAPWAMAVAATLRRERGLEVDTLWADDGILFRLSAGDDPPEADVFLPDADAVRDLVLDELGGSALFAARFRENAARALLLPRRAPGRRTPLWVQRRRSADLLQVVSRHPDFPIVLETYRECVTDVFDLRALEDLLRGVAERRLRFHAAETRAPSPVAASLMFGYVANFLYEGDAPLAERRAQALTLDHAQLLALLGEPELRDLLDADAVAEVALRVARLDGRRPLRDADDLHDLLLDLGDLALDEIVDRVGSAPGRPAGPEDAEAATRWLDELESARRVARVRVASEERWIAAEDAARYRDALGTVPPQGLPSAILEPVDAPLEDLVSRYARTHGPFAAASAATRLGLGVAPVTRALAALAERGRVVHGHFLPGGSGREWVDAGVLRQIKRRSLAALRAEVEPVEPPALARFAVAWHGLDRSRGGIDALLEVVERLQGAGLPASDLESAILPARLRGYDPRDLDELCAAGDVLWRGVAPLGQSDGRVALYLYEHYRLLTPGPGDVGGDLARTILSIMQERGAVFFADLAAATGAFVGDLLPALWDLVWAGWVSNDTLAPLRSLKRTEARRRRRGRITRRRAAPPGAEGRWSLLPDARAALENPRDPLEGARADGADGGGPPPARPDVWSPASPTERAAALASQLLVRHGVVTRETALAEALPGGFSGVYPVLKSMEEAGRIRRGYFIEGLGGAQFALAGAEDRLRAYRDDPAEPGEPRLLAATDPANPYGAALPWPEGRGAARPRRAAGAQVVLHAGRLVGFVSPSGRRVLTFVAEGGREEERALDALADALAGLAEARGRSFTILRTVDGVPPGDSVLADRLRELGFRPSERGWLRRREPPATGRLHVRTRSGRA
ncbi:MAG TPA: crosslink repair DNA glycosylase YcaQ family protein [Longimicrobiales bacterium]|nr:crosslink repair DNA glycosylase YcaQ family protein [Longimicrobiales bacterium]